MQIDTNRFRLRNNQKIVGYKKQIGNSVFYSKDEYAWSGSLIEFTIQDKFTRFFDNNRRAIYAEDIIEFTKNEDIKFALILFDEILDTFQLLDLSAGEIVSNNAYDFLLKNPFVFKSFHFIQPNV